MKKAWFWILLLFFISQQSSPLGFSQDAGDKPPLDCGDGYSQDEKTPHVFLEDLTWPEVKQALCSGKRAVLIPTAGTEQNGPHMILGKHHYIIHYTSERIARELGTALVAPVIDYVPEGEISPRTGHMLFPGTISLPEKVFEETLEYAARSLIANGFEDIFFIGEHGANQAGQAQVALKLSQEFSSKGIHVWHVSNYYSERNGQVQWLKDQGLNPEQIGIHAAIRDTSELLAAHPEGIRKERLAPGASWGQEGVWGKPSKATAEYGEKLLQLKITAALAQIREFLASKKV